MRSDISIPSSDQSARPTTRAARHSWGWIAPAILGIAVLPAQVVAPSGAAAILALSAVMAGVWLLANRTFPPAYRSSLIVTMAVALLWGMVSAVWSIDPHFPLKQAGVLVSLTVVWAAIVQADPKTLSGLPKWIVTGIAIGLALILFELFSNGVLNNLLSKAMGYQAGWRVPRINRSVALLVLLLWPSAGYLCRPGRRGLAAVLAVGTLVAVAFGPSASVKIATATSLVVWLIVRFVGRRAVHALTAAAVAVVMLAPLWVTYVVTPNNLYSVLPNIGTSALHRTYMWQFGIKRTAEKPLLGWGYDTTRKLPGGDVSLHTEIFHPAGPVPSMGTHPHNWAVQMWVELGAVGALLLSAMIAALGRLIARCDGNRLVQAAMAACMGFAFVLTNLMWGTWQSWWLSSLGVSCVLFALVRRLAAARPPPSPTAP